MPNLTPELIYAAFVGLCLGLGAIGTYVSRLGAKPPVIPRPDVNQVDRIAVALETIAKASVEINDRRHSDLQQMVAQLTEKMRTG